MSIKTFYTSPEISVRQMNVERGFAASLGQLVNKNSNYTISNGGVDDEFDN